MGLGSINIRVTTRPRLGLALELWLRLREDWIKVWNRVGIGFRVRIFVGVKIQINVKVNVRFRIMFTVIISLRVKVRVRSALAPHKIVKLFKIL